MLRMAGAVLVAAALLQEDPAETLRAGWRGVDTVASGGRPARDRVAALAKGGSFYAKAALAEIDALDAPGAAALVRTESLKNVSSAEAIPALFRKAGLRCNLARLPDRPITLPDGLALLEALDAAGAQLDVEFYAGEGGVWRVTAGYLRAPRFAFRRFRGRLDRIALSTRNDFASRPIDSLQLRARLSGDEGARIIAMGGLEVLEAVDDRGTDLKRAGRLTIQNLPEGFTAAIDLAAPAAEAVRIDRLRIRFDVTYERKRETLTFGDVLRLKGEEKSAGNARLKVRGVSRDGDGWRVDIESGAPLDAFRLTDEDGRPLELESVALPVVRFRGGRIPATFSVAVVTETATRTVYAEFTGVPLP
jgi:hypothetical protein